jgi:hypothetical protein
LVRERDEVMGMRVWICLLAGLLAWGASAERASGPMKVGVYKAELVKLSKAWETNTDFLVSSEYGKPTGVPVRLASPRYGDEEPATKSKTGLPEMEATVFPGASPRVIASFDRNGDGDFNDEAAVACPRQGHAGKGYSYRFAVVAPITGVPPGSSMFVDVDSRLQVANVIVAAPSGWCARVPGEHGIYQVYSSPDEQDVWIDGNGDGVRDDAEVHPGYFGLGVAGVLCRLKWDDGAKLLRVVAEGGTRKVRLDFVDGVGKSRMPEQLECSGLMRHIRPPSVVELPVVVAGMPEWSARVNVGEGVALTLAGVRAVTASGAKMAVAAIGGPVSVDAEVETAGSGGFTPIGGFTVSASAATARGQSVTASGGTGTSVKVFDSGGKMVASGKLESG